MSNVEKCVYIFSIIFSVLPERILSSISASDVYSRKSVSIDPQSSYYPSSRFDEVLNEELDPKAEPGFNLTPEEITRLKIWPQGVVPYYIDIDSFQDKVLRDRIREFLGIVNSLTGLNFMELNVVPTSDERWVLFVNRRGQLECADHSILNFTDTGPQRVVLGYDCMLHGELAEAVLAIAGVPPQHDAPDRDEYIEVIEENIIPEKKYLFRKFQNDEWLFHDLPYDFHSAGHYDFHKFSMNGKVTIKPKNYKAGNLFASSNGLSNLDVRKIKMLYNFISQKTPTNLPECYKLFNKGSNFDQYHRLHTLPIPRRKPKQFLNRPNTETELSNEEKNNSTNTDSEPDKEPDASFDESYEHKPELQNLKRLNLLKVGARQILAMSDFPTDREKTKSKLNKKNIQNL